MSFKKWFHSDNALKIFIAGHQPVGKIRQTSLDFLQAQKIPLFLSASKKNWPKISKRILI